jgi:hypothetical protein
VRLAADQDGQPAILPETVDVLKATGREGCQIARHRFAVVAFHFPSPFVQLDELLDPSCLGPRLTPQRDKGTLPADEVVPQIGGRGHMVTQDQDAARFEDLVELLERASFAGSVVKGHDAGDRVKGLGGETAGPFPGKVDDLEAKRAAQVPQLSRATSSMAAEPSVT